MYSDITYALAKFWGGFGLIMAIMLFAKPKLLDDLFKEFDHQSGTTMVAAFLTITIGLASLALYAKWSFDWRVLITIFGWLTLLKGVRILMWPDILKNIGQNEKLAKYVKYMIAFIGVMSAYLFHKGLQ